MRYVSLNPGTSEPLLNLARARMREEEFISLFKACLSLLAIAEAEDLDYVQSKLLPHRLSLDCDPPAPSCETAQATPNRFLSSPHAMENPRQSDVHPDIGSGQSLSAGSAPRPTTSDTADEYDLFARYTTLEDHSSPNERAASVDTEMSNCGEDATVAPTASTSIIQSSTPPTFENTSDTPTAADPSDPANNDMITVPSLLKLEYEPST
ncbi:hypothetical protein EJ07DRAFT_171101 [Lizonia empirigonia]|nr:hypothetical protein EJ07DRAFT_171101 [Lizonia empirigonia]